MCLVCAEWQKGNLTNKEALRNIGEYIRAPKDTAEENAHYYKVVDDIMEKELGKLDDQLETETSWHDENYGER